MATGKLPDDIHDAADPGGAGEDFDEGRPSKTRRKKEMHALQALGERLVALPEARLKAVPLDEDLRNAIDMARGIRSHEGRRRQLQYVGRLMRSADAAAIEASLAGDDAAHARQVAAHHAAEQWRDGLIDGSRKLGDFITRFPLPALAADPVDPDGDEAARAPRKGEGKGKDAKETKGTKETAATLTGLVEAARDAAGSDGANPRHARALYRALHQWLLTYESAER